MDESARRHAAEHATEEEPAWDHLPHVAPAIAALTLAAAGLTLVAGYWLWRSSRRDADRRAAFPTPAVHRRP